MTHTTSSAASKRRASRRAYSNAWSDSSQASYANTMCLIALRSFTLRSLDKRPARGARERYDYPAPEMSISRLTS